MARLSALCKALAAAAIAAMPVTLGMAPASAHDGNPIPYAASALLPEDLERCRPLAKCPDPRLVALGRKLFFDVRLSGSQAMSCATCHEPAHGWSASKQTAEKFARLPRSIPPVINLAYQRWFFWDGRQADLSLQALEPLESEREMDGHRLMLADVLARHYSRDVQELRLVSPSGNVIVKRWMSRAACVRSGDCAALWNKIPASDKKFIDQYISTGLHALESFQLSLRTPLTRFDRYVTSPPAARKAVLTPAEVRGMDLFFSKARCALCHTGKGFTDGEFHNLMLPSTSFRPPEDPGRFAAVRALLDTSQQKQEQGHAGSHLTHFLKLDGSMWGQFRTPSLRSLKDKSEFMHNGSMKTLREVLEYYNTLDRAVVVSHHSNSLLVPLKLSNAELDDLESFIKVLSE